MHNKIDKIIEIIFFFKKEFIEIIFKIFLIAIGNIYKKIKDAFITMLLK